MSAMSEGSPHAEARTLLHALHVACGRARFLPARHPSMQRIADETHALLAGMLAQHPNLTLGIQDGVLFVDGTRLGPESRLYEGLRDALGASGIHCLRFRRGLTAEETMRLLEACFQEPERRTGEKMLHLAPDAFPHVEVNPATGPGRAREAGPLPVPLLQAREVYQASVRAVVELYYDSRRRRSLDIVQIDRLVLALQEGINTRPALYLAMAQLRDVSDYTFYHAVNVAIVSMLLGKGIGLSPSQVHRAGVAAMLYDVGKTQVPLEILDKPAKLDNKERAIMERHPLESMRILSAQKEVHPSTIAVALQHHVRFDGAGYPDFQGWFGGLHLFSHIAAIADVYDALCSRRAYQAALLPDQAMEIMLQGMGKQFHPLLVKALFQVVGFYPVGTLVELDTGEYAVVHRANPSAPLRPVVKMLTPPAAQGETYRLLDLDQPAATGYYPRTIVRALDPARHGVRIAGLL